MGDLNRADGTRIAVHSRSGRGPTIIFLPGYASDMAGTKAVALDAWAERTGRSFVRFDYGGCGVSEGAFADQTLADWLSDALLVIDSVPGPLTLVGSSMGGWIMLLAALARPDRVAALIGLAAALDFTDWGFTQDQKLVLLRDGQVAEHSEYGPPLITTRAFWQSGEAHRLLQHAIAIDAPVRLIHGQRDVDVPWHHSPHLAGQLRSADVQVTLVKDGDHRLSRPQDIALLIATIEALPEFS
ncbi:alpha/beta hydrolase [Sphingomonas paeninsulae]|uniref:Alpha/beta hydrolase n=1 Tax=Sphingomonas paeninsulae TaxID=2319844 RepID=A0A494TAF9_SPHPE|nr:alpha/beta hydrolase [Sphingomonas paeninsulae]AYJ86307.1 alpha/beta hydrolase [Sphingomonas paeninsulae]